MGTVGGRAKPLAPLDAHRRGAGDVQGPKRGHLFASSKGRWLVEVNQDRMSGAERNDGCTGASANAEHAVSPFRRGEEGNGERNRHARMVIFSLRRSWLSNEKPGWLRLRSGVIDLLFSAISMFDFRLQVLCLDGGS